jgi:biopolymer transport protein ExbB/TolQ
MDFLYKLFPFRSLFNIDGETLTAWWVLLIIAVFLIYFIRVLLLTSKLKKRIKIFTKDFSKHKILKDAYLSSAWKDYNESFIDFNDEEKTDDYSYEYFNEKNLMASNSNFKLINSIPNILVGLGILGTFVGLTYGISNFNTGSTEQIKSSIQILLSGMGTAFISSIYGMFFSLLFTFFEKVQINSLYQAIHKLCYNLDRKFKVSKNDERLIQVQNQKTLLDEYFIFTDEQNNKVKPGNILRDIFGESKKQSFALQSFSTDLAEVIEAGFEKILNDPDKGVTYELQNLKDEIVNLGSKLQDPASEMTQNVVKELEKSMSTMIEEFKTIE